MDSNGVGMALLWSRYGLGIGKVPLTAYFLYPILFEFEKNLFQNKSHVIMKRHFTLNSLLEYGL
jgi:hypothetical protein